MRFDAVLGQARSEVEVQRTIKGDDRVADNEKNRLIENEIAALKKYVKELLFQAACCECNRMAAVPQAAFAVLQVRKNFDREYAAKFHEEEDESKRDNKNCGFSAKVLQEGRELTPLKYNSKLMNSIWGLYNRYSVHNFKKIDANDTSLSGAWGALCAATPAAEAERIAAAAGH